MFWGWELQQRASIYGKGGGGNDNICAEHLQHGGSCSILTVNGRSKSSITALEETPKCLLTSKDPMETTSYQLQRSGPLINHHKGARIHHPGEEAAYPAGVMLSSLPNHLSRNFLWRCYLNNPRSWSEGTEGRGQGFLSPIRPREGFWNHWKGYALAISLQ